MREVGRLRELTFRSAGGGTGAEVDIDEYDFCKIATSSSLSGIQGTRDTRGYRFHTLIHKRRRNQSFTKHLFNFSEKFQNEYMPQMIELGRSFVQPKYQAQGRSGKGLYALDNLWDGLGALIVLNPHIKYFFGKVTMYNTYNVEARNMLFYFFEKYFKDSEGLVIPIHPIEVQMDRGQLASIFHGQTYAEDYKILSHKLGNSGRKFLRLLTRT
jgi:hypothetical protein